MTRGTHVSAMRVGGAPESWLLLQDNHDLWVARQRVDLKRVAKLRLVAA